MEFFKVLDIAQVLALREGFGRVSSEEIALEEALGRILAAEVRAPEDLPPFSRATVDGYAVRAASTFGASDANPACLSLVGAVAMAEVPCVNVGSGQAVWVATGAMLPEGADGVVMREHAEALDETSIEVFRSVAPGQNVIAAGEDFAAGAVLAPAGSRLRPQELGALAAFGLLRVRVFRRPVVGILSTGDEIVPAGEAPGPARIRDLNRYSLSGLTLQAGCIPRPLGIVPDRFEALHAACREALAACDAVLISGGSSVGTRDFTVEALQAFPDARILAHGIAISPGKPTILARVGDKAVWGLPGHVASAMIVFARIVRPFLLSLAGLAPGDPEEVRLPARLTRNLASAQGRTDFVRVRLIRRNEGWWAEPVLGKSGLIRTLVHSDGLVEIPAFCEGLDEGAAVEVILF